MIRNATVSLGAMRDEAGKPLMDGVGDGSGGHSGRVASAGEGRAIAPDEPEGREGFRTDKVCVCVASTTR